MAKQGRGVPLSAPQYARQTLNAALDLLDGVVGPVDDDVGSHIVREDGGHLLREDGGKFVRES